MIRLTSRRSGVDLRNVVGRLNQADDAIDLSDIPEVGEEWFKRAKLREKGGVRPNAPPTGFKPSIGGTAVVKPTASAPTFVLICPVTKRPCERGCANGCRDA